MVNSTVTTNDSELRFDPGQNSSWAMFDGEWHPAWSVFLFIFSYSIIMVLAVVGNTLILIVEQFNKQKTSTDWLVTFMSANDLVLAGFNTPIYLLLYNGSWSSVGSDFLCGMMFYLQESLSFSSTLLLTVTAIDRYIKTCRPHSTGLTSRRAMYTCIGITVFTLAQSVSIPIYIRYDEVRQCTYKIPGDAAIVFRVILYFVQGFYVIMFVAVIVCYCKIALTIRRRVRALKRTAYGSQSNPCATDETPARPSSNQTLATRLTSFHSNKVAPLPLQTSDSDCLRGGFGTEINTSDAAIEIKETANDHNCSIASMNNGKIEERHAKDKTKPSVTSLHDKTVNNEKIVETYAKDETQLNGTSRDNKTVNNERMVETQAKVETQPNVISPTCNDKMEQKTDKVQNNDHTNNDPRRTPSTDKSANDNTRNTTDEDQASRKRQFLTIPVQTWRNRNKNPRNGNQSLHITKESQMNKTTAIMFAVTVVFILSWIPPWIVAALWSYEASVNQEERIAIMFCRRSFMVNTCTNPLFYIGMSSTFRHLTKQTMRKIWCRIQTALGIIRSP